MLENVKKQVYELLDKDSSGHGSDHIDRVLKLSLKFAQTENNVNKDVLALIALLHDVDDHKLFGKEYSENLINAKEIMHKANVPNEVQNEVLSSLKCIGYSKLLDGFRPTSIEGKIVSDAYMCDALGVVGILRVYKYNLKHEKPFFDRNIFPIEDMTAGEYAEKGSATAVCHMFEKILKLKGLMMTNSGKEEANERHKIVVNILHHLFKEEDVPEWEEYLNKYLSDKN